jgi:hypothetical protein
VHKDLRSNLVRCNLCSPICPDSEELLKQVVHKLEEVRRPGEVP